MTAEEKSQARRQRMAKVEREFYKLVDISMAAKKLNLNVEVVDIISKFWTLKRIAAGNKPLLLPRGDDETSALKGEDSERDKMKQLVNIRQDLERVRNLAYMVSRREKLSRSFIKIREQILEKQLVLLADDDPQNQMSLVEASAIIEANHGPTIYDKIFSNPESEQHTHEEFEVIVSRIAGEISEGSAQIRRDNPFRKKSTDLLANTRSVPYERILSDTSQSESDDSILQNVPLKPKKKRESNAKLNKKLLSKTITRSDSSMSSSEEEDALKKLAPSKEVRSNQRKSIYSESDSEKSDTEIMPRGRGRPPKKQKLKEVKNLKKTEIRNDSEDTQNSMDSRPKEVRTKAAMKEFTAEDMALAKKIMEEKNKMKNKATPIDESDDNSIMEVDQDDVDSDTNPFTFVPQRGAARKAEQKFSQTKKAQPEKKKSTMDLFGTSDDDSRERLSKKIEERLMRVSDSDEDNSLSLRKSPRRSSGHKKKQTSTDSESEEEAGRNISSKISTKDRKKHKQLSDIDKLLCKSKKTQKSSEKKKTKSKDSSSEDDFLKTRKEDAKPKEPLIDFDDLFDKETRLSGSDSDSDHGKKKLFDDFENPEIYSDFVPQRKAAKKASAQLSEQKLWKKTQQEAYLAELAQIQIEKENTKRQSKSKKNKNDSRLSSDSDTAKRRPRSSDSSTSSSSDSEADRRKSPRGRGKSPKGKSKLSKLQQKKVGPRKQRTKKSPRAKTDGKIHSSKALEYLMQRESQINNILTELSKDTVEETLEDKLRNLKPPPEPPGTKLKTSEGRPEDVQSPPKSTKNSSDSDSDTDSDDSVIRGIKDRKQREAEKSTIPDGSSNVATIGEISEKEDDIKRGPESMHESPTKAGEQKLGRRSGDNSDFSMEESRNRRESGNLSRNTSAKSLSAEGEQLKQPAAGSFHGQKKSIFSPDRSPRTPSDQGRSSKSGSGGLREQDSTNKKEIEGPTSWRSPREWKRSETGISASPKEKVGRELPTPSKSPAKSPALSRSFEGSRSSPLQVQSHRSPVFGRSPARHSQHPLNKSLDLNKSVESKNKTEINESVSSKKVFDTAQKKSENEAADENQTDKEKARKLSIESKDSDADSAKSSLPDPIENGLPDFSKEDSTDTLDFGDKLSDLRDSKLKVKEPTPALSKTDEGYVSAEKVQNDNAQEIKQRDNLQNLPPADKLNLNKCTNRLSTEDSIGSQELPHPKPDSAWPQMFGQASANIQQQMLENQRSRQQKQDITNSSDIFAKSLENFTKQSRQGDKKVADAIASQQQQQYEAFFNQMFNMQRKSGPEISQQQMAYAQQAYQAYQYQYLQQMQAYGLKVRMKMLQSQESQIKYGINIGPYFEGEGVKH